jgi:methionine synthase I (cobalamin-dependent)
MLLLETHHQHANASRSTGSIGQALSRFRAGSFPSCSPSPSLKPEILLSGESLEEFWNSVKSRKPYSVGINCSFGARHVVPFIESLARLSTVSVSCHPSAGLPKCFRRLRRIASRVFGNPRRPPLPGVIQIAGGCCGTTPAHIRMLTIEGL